MDVSAFFFVVLSCVGMVFASGWSPVQGFLPNAQIDSYISGRDGLLWCRRVMIYICNKWTSRQMQNSRSSASFCSYLSYCNVSPLCFKREDSFDLLRYIAGAWWSISICGHILSSWIVLHMLLKGHWQSVNEYTCVRFPFVNKFHVNGKFCFMLNLHVALWPWLQDC
jgi:hypothetical protein